MKKHVNRKIIIKPHNIGQKTLLKLRAMELKNDHVSKSLNSKAIL